MFAGTDLWILGPRPTQSAKRSYRGVSDVGRWDHIRDDTSRYGRNRPRFGGIGRDSGESKAHSLETSSAVNPEHVECSGIGNIFRWICVGHHVVHQVSIIPFGQCNGGVLAVSSWL